MKKNHIVLLAILALLCTSWAPYLTVGDLRAACPYTNFAGQTLHFFGTPDFFSSDGSVSINVGGYSKVVSYGGVTGRGRIIQSQCWNDLGDIAVWVNAF